MTPEHTNTHPIHTPTRWSQLWTWATQAHPAITDEISRRSVKLLAGMLLGAIIFGLFIIGFVIWLNPEDATSIEVRASFVTIIICIGLYIGTKLGWHKWTLPLFLLTTSILFVTIPYVAVPVMLPFALVSVLIASIFYTGRRATIITIFIVGLTLVLNETVGRNGEDIIELRVTWYFLVLGSALTIIFAQHMNNLAQIREQKLQQANELLKQSEMFLEQRVQERTRDLKLSSEVAKQVTTILRLEDLLPRLVEQTRETFDLYNVGVFLYQEAEQQLILQAGTGKAGQQMLEQGVSYPLAAQPSLVAKAARDKQSIVINDVTAEKAHANNPYLPNTQSEIVLPMLVGNKLIGVLGMQSEITDRFTPADVEIFSTLAEQIAIAVNNAQLYARQRQLTEELRQADKAKTQFLASMSHELRTPLNGIMNFTEMVSSGMIGDVNEEQKELLDRSLDSSKHLLNLINDVLDINKIQDGKLNLFMEDNVDLYEQLSSVTNLIKPMLREGSVTLIEDVHDNLPSIRGDKRRIRQILLNLASNAAKFTHEGTITISAKNQGEHILFTVIDTGAGISAEMQGIIFEPFIQTVDGVKQAQGTGLGLPITKSLVEAHGGRLWLESKPGEGSAFYVTLPIQATETKQLIAIKER